MTNIGDLTTVLAERYAISRQLGAGGMAVVYLAREVKHDREVALKVLRPELAAILGAERFLQEIRISARLEHPHILTLIDSGESDGFLWYVLPYVRGESLREKLAREKQVSIEEAVRIATQVASALDYAHRRGVIHRDVKPENILLHEGEAMVADFGIALAVHEAGGPRITESGLSLGTPQYMSPEQATAGRQLDARSDVYSLAAVMYEMLTGEPPHSGPTAQAVIAKLITERPTRIRIVREAVPESIDSAVARALSKVPADRFSSTMEFAAALGAPGGGPSRGRRSMRVAIAAGIAVALLLVTIAAVWHPWRRATTLPAPPIDVASVAVMPFENLTGDTAYQFLSNGMMEEVIGQLAKVPGLKVISRNSTEALKGAHLTTRQIADTLRVRNILDGSLRRATDTIRVTVHLVDATTDRYIWTSSYDRDVAHDLTNAFAMEEEIARHVADSLVSAVGMRRNVTPVVRTEHPGAYAAYLAGRDLVYRRTRDALSGAVEQFQHAIAQDSSYAPAYAGLAQVYFLWVSYNYSGVDLYEAYGRAWAYAERAISLEPDLAEAHAARGYVMARSWAPTESISEDFKQAVALRPNSADVRQWYSQFLMREARYTEAFDQVRRAAELDPVAPGVRIAVANVGVGARRYDVTAQEADRALALAPSIVRVRTFQALGSLLLGSPMRCAALSLGPYVAVRAMCLYSLGRVQDASHVADSLATAFTTASGGQASFSPVTAAQGLAEYYAWIGNVDESLAWLERAYAISPMGEDFMIIQSGVYDKVRDDVRFKSAIERIHMMIYERVRRARASVEHK
jgi:serine/threonine-protein kinase